MKKLLMVVGLFAISTQAFSLDTDLSKKALNKLMNKNPVAITASGQPEKVNTLIAHMMTSSFDENGQGVLSVVENTCERQERTVVCELNIYSSDRLRNSKGSYVQPDDSTESSLKINYRFTEGLFFLSGKVTYFFAG